MGDILIRNLDESVISAWKKRAQSNGRSLQAELHAQLATAVDMQRKEELIEQARAIRQGAHSSRLGVPGWQLIREDRDSR
jgi:antitoxin FitA